MPLYEYRCEACGHQFEKIQRFSDDPISVCPSCGQGPVVKLLSSPAIQFKGSGWYITDYARKGQSDQGSAKSSNDASGAESKESKPADSKPVETASTSAPAAPAKSDSGKKD
jgi:putative FmdB family regulatory protein